MIEKSIISVEQKKKQQQNNNKNIKKTHKKQTCDVNIINSVR